MNNCRMCLEPRDEANELEDLKADLKLAINAFFQSKMNTEPFENFSVCMNCEITILEFYGFYQKVLENQQEYECLVKVEQSGVTIKEESLSAEYLDYEHLVESDENDLTSASPKFNESPSSLKIKIDTETKPKSIDGPIKLARLPGARQRRQKDKRSNKAEKDAFIKKHFGLQCPECNVPEFNTYDAFREHLQSRHNVEKYEFRCCGRSFIERWSAADHAMGHLKDDRLKCNACGKHCDNYHAWRYHMKTHSSDKFMCDICSNTFNTIGVLRMHMFTHLSSEEKDRLKKYECKFCGYRFIKNFYLAKHIRDIHERSRCVHCDICSKKFSTKENLRTHKSTVHASAEPLMCTQCEYVAPNRKYFNKHIRDVHSPGPHLCGICGKEASTRLGLRTHIRYNHKQVANHECSYCGKLFKLKTNLKEHMTVHTGERLYKCTYCDKTFNSNANMYSHRKKQHPQEWERDRKQAVNQSLQFILP